MNLDEMRQHSCWSNGKTQVESAQVEWKSYVSNRKSYATINNTAMPVSVRTQLFQLLGYSPSDFAAQTRSVPLHTTIQDAMVQFKQAREPAPEIDLFHLKSQVIHALIKQWYGRGTYCEQLQILISQELHMFNLIQSFYPSEKYTVSRRDVLAALAASPLLLLQSKRIITKPHPEEWLPHCTAGVTACWYLLNGDGDDLCTIEKTLRVYLPSLLDLARQSSLRYQKTAAALAAQSFLLLDLVSYHRTQFADSLQYANEAVRLAEIVGDPTLSVYALLLSGGAYNLNQQHAKMTQDRDTCKIGHNKEPVFDALFQHSSMGRFFQQHIEKTLIDWNLGGMLLPELKRGLPCSQDLRHSLPLLIRNGTQ